MLRHLGENGPGQEIENAVGKLLQEEKVTTLDLGGSATTDDVAKELTRILTH
jgi:isocitrate dehydrogenase (NAD+)